MISRRAKIQLKEDISNFMGHIRPKDNPKENDLIDVGVGNIRGVTRISEAISNHAEEFAKEAIKLSGTYPGTQGYEPLNEKISELIFKETKKRYEPKRIVLTNGVFDGLTKSFFCYNNAKDNVFYFAPCFPYKATADRTELNTIEKISINPTYIKNHFGEDYEFASKNSKISSVVINTPHNPSGAMISDSQLKKVNEVAKKDNAMIFLDNVYGTFTNDKKWAGDNFDEEHMVLLDGFSKKFAFPGLRMGYMITPEDDTKFVSATIANQYIGVSMSSVAFADKLLDVLFQEKLLNVIPKEIEIRQNNLDKGLKNIEKLDIISPTPDGGMYRVMLIDEFCKKTGYDDIKLAKAFLDLGVKTVPGSMLYPVHIDKKKAPLFIRLSAGGDSRTKEAGERIVEVLQNIYDKKN